MRVFSTEAVWDKDEQKWMQMFTIDGFETDLETYTMELENEVHDNEEGVIAYPEEEHDEDCTCQDCQEDRKNIYLAEAVKFMFENELCPKHVFEMLGDIYDKGNYEGYEEGYEECKEEMREFLED